MRGGQLEGDGGPRHHVSICTVHPSWWGEAHSLGPCFCPQGTPENPGINQRALQLLFSEVQEKASDWAYTITVSAAEIYNEALRWAQASRAARGPQGRMEQCGMGSGVSLKQGVGGCMS